MPTYDYRCQANGQMLEVRHGINEQLETWGQLVERLGLELGETSADSPVERLATGGAVVQSASLKNPEAPPCMSGQGCCGGGMCGI